MTASRAEHAAAQMYASAYATDSPRPLDFLVNGQLLRQSLLQLMLDSNVSAVRAGLESQLLLGVRGQTSPGLLLTRGLSLLRVATQLLAGPW